MLKDPKLNYYVIRVHVRRQTSDIRGCNEAPLLSVAPSVQGIF